MNIDHEIREYRICRDWEDQAWADDMHERISSMARRAMAEFTPLRSLQQEWWEAVRNMPYQPSQQQFVAAQQQYNQQVYDPYMMGNPLGGILSNLGLQGHACQCCGR